MKKILFLFCVLMFSVPHLRAQGKGLLAPKDTKEFRYLHEASAGLRIHSDAVTCFAEKAWIKNIYNKKVLQVEFTYFFDPRQRRQEGTSIGNRNYKSFIYGKQNNFFAFHLNYGYRKTIAEKAKRSGVALYFVYMAGFSLGLEKPYYLELRTLEDPNVTRPERYTSENADRFLDYKPGGAGTVAGYAGMQYGFGKMKPVPGGHIKLGLHFDWAGHEQFIRALELGVSADIYYRKVNVMINNYNKPYFINAYLSFQIGKRW